MIKSILIFAAACAGLTMLTGCGPKAELSSNEQRVQEAFRADTASFSSAAGGGEAVAHPLPGDPAAGEAVYMRVCAACHQKDGSGMNGMLAADFVKDKSRLAKSNEVLLNSIANGITLDNRIMPPQKDVLSEQERKDVLSYIRQTFGSVK